MAETSFKASLDNGRALLRDIIKENHKFEMSPVKDLDFFRLIKNRQNDNFEIPILVLKKLTTVWYIITSFF